MPVELNHTIVPAHDPQASAQFLADILGLPVDPPVAHFTPVTLANGVSLDYDHYDHVDEHHYASQLSDAEWEAAFDPGRSGMSTWLPHLGSAAETRGAEENARIEGTHL
jgi:catechol 2,3-dioxygenase-like lactoylglutathione lyase family enzyme